MMLQVTVNKGLVVLSIYFCRDTLKTLRNPELLGIRHPSTISPQEEMVLMHTHYNFLLIGF